MFTTANSNSIINIYEIELTTGKIIKKYSLEQQSTQVSQVWISQDFIALQAEQAEGPFTYLLDRKYSHGLYDAITAIPHPKDQGVVFLDFEQETNRFVLINIESIREYTVSRPQLTIFPIDPALEAKEIELTLVAKS